MTRTAHSGFTVDPLLCLVGVSLVLIGLVAIASASIGYAEWRFSNPWYHAQRHFLYILLGAFSAAVVYRMPTVFWYRTAWLWLLLSLALLSLVLVPGIGKSVNGSQRWLPLGPLTLQPSELVKGASVLFLAGYLQRQQSAVRQQWQGFLRPMLVLAVIALLLLFEPDFGATVIVFGAALGMLFLAGMRLLHFLLVIGLCGAGVIALVLAAPYRVQRLVAYTDPWADPYGSGFQLIQSLIAFGRGEWFGVGLGNSVQKLFYLPEAHTDFVFSIWAEETGFVGALVLVLLVAVLVARIAWVGLAAAREGNAFAAYLCYGVALVFAGQSFINMGASSGLLPTKGLTLPFVSYGGTALLCSCVLLAMILRIESDLRSNAAGGDNVSALAPLVLMLAGGTGGHVYPALAVARELLQRGYRVEWVGTDRGLEASVVPAAGIPLHRMPMRGLRGKGLLHKLRAVVVAAWSVLLALRLLLRRAPSCVVGMGGYVSAPAGIAAWILRRPLLLHEQNAVAGTSNRLLAPLASKVVCGFPGAFPSRNDVEVLGNPVRRELLETARASQWFYDGTRPLRLLVLGGSLGASPLNDLIPAGLQLLAQEHDVLSPEVWHQCGAAHLAATQNRYREGDLAAVRCVPFIDDMADAYAWSDLVVCRAGALTVAELAIMARPSLLIPLPHAIDDHQARNADFLEQQGAARVCAQASLDARALAALLAQFIGDPAQLARMSRACRRCAFPDATVALADRCEGLLR